MKITEKIQSDLRQAAERCGGAGEFARKCGIDAANISRYLSGKVKSISDANWEKLSPYLPGAAELPESPDTIRNTLQLREFIKDGMLRKNITSAGALNQAIGYDSVHTISRLLSGELNFFPDLLGLVFNSLDLDVSLSPLNRRERDLLMPPEYFRGGGTLVRPIPVVAWANAASELALIAGNDDPLCRHWNPEFTETVPVPIGGRKDTLAFKVCGVSMEPRIVDDDVILVEPAHCIEDIPSNKIVVVKFADSGKFPESVVCKRFHRQNGHLLLTSDNPEGKIIPFEAGDVSFIGIVVRKISEL